MVTQVAFSDLNSWLQAQPENTPDTPYELEISGLTTNNVVDSAFGNSLGYIFRNNNKKYVDLSETIIPSSVTNGNSIFRTCETLVKSPLFPDSIIYFDSVFDGCINLKEVQNIPSTPAGGKVAKGLQNTFRNCKSLISVPDFPDTILILDGVFYGCTSLERAPKLPNSVTLLGSTFAFCSSLKNAPQIPNSVTSLPRTFSGCTSLINAPVIPDSVTNMTYTFQNCTSLVNAPVIPNSVTNMECAFNSCSSLAYKPIIPATVTTSTNCYKNVTTLNWKGTKSQAGLCPNDCEYQLYNDDRVTLEDTIYNVDISTLSTYLADLNANAVATAYKIYIRGLTTSNASDIKTALSANQTKYVDLSYTTIPQGTSLDGLFYLAISEQIGCESLVKSPVLPTDVTILTETFRGCTNLQEVPILPPALQFAALAFYGCNSLVTTGNINISTLTSCGSMFKFCTKLTTIQNMPPNLTDMSHMFSNCPIVTMPIIPSTVTDMDGTFEFCDSLITTTDIPDFVESMNETFYGCSKITRINQVPSTVEYAQRCFYGCTSLKTIEKFLIPVSTLDGINFEDMFAECSSLVQIGHKPAESMDWHLVYFSFDDNGIIHGKVYDRNKNIVEIPQTPIENTIMQLPVCTKELLIDNIIRTDELESIIEGYTDNEGYHQGILDTHYPWYKRFVSDPSGNHIILYAKDKTKFKISIDS